jgi:hypothetical protein
VTFYADGDTVHTEPVFHCDVYVQSCTEGDPAQLSVRPGKPVQISVPSPVVDTPWCVVTGYVTPQGAPQVKGEVFSPGTQHAYTASPPSPADQLLLVEVQQVGAAVAREQPETGQRLGACGSQFAPRAAWRLQIVPA